MSSMILYQSLELYSDSLSGLDDLFMNTSRLTCPSVPLAPCLSHNNLLYGPGTCSFSSSLLNLHILLPLNFLLLNPYTANWTPLIFLKESMSLGAKADAEDMVCHMTRFLFQKPLLLSCKSTVMKSMSSIIIIL